MKCPKCGATTNIKWFLRHQDRESDTIDDVNVITILCTECGYNDSVFLEEYLDDIFKDWSEIKQDNNFDFNSLFNFISNSFLGEDDINER